MFKLKTRRFALSLISTLLCSTLVVSAGTSSITKSLTAIYQDIKVSINDNNIMFKDDNGNEIEPFIVDGVTYLPLRAIAEAVGYDVTWDIETNTIMLENMENIQSAENNSPLLNFNECFIQIAKISKIIDTAVVYTANKMIMFIKKDDCDSAQKFIDEMETDIYDFFDTSIESLDKWISVLKNSEGVKYNALYNEVVSARLILKTAYLATEMFFVCAQDYAYGTYDEDEDDAVNVVMEYYDSVKIKNSELTDLANGVQNQIYDLLLDIARNYTQ